jgi:hypothetical protein
VVQATFLVPTFAEFADHYNHGGGVAEVADSHACVAFLVLQISSVVSEQEVQIC